MAVQAKRYIERPVVLRRGTSHITPATLKMLIQKQGHLIDPEPQTGIRERRHSSPRRKSESEKKAFGNRVAAQVAQLKNDPDAWQAYLDERNGMAGSLKDGLDKE